MRGMVLRRALRDQPCKQALCNSSSSSSTFTTKATPGVPPHSPAGSTSSSSSNRSSGVAVRELTANKSAAQEEKVAKRIVVPRRLEWRPSEAHRESATSVARKENAHLKAGTTPRAAAPSAARDGTGKAKSAGLRRRALLGGAEYVPSQAQLAAAAGVPSPASGASKSPAAVAAAAAAAAAVAAGEAGMAPSVVTLSATNRFRARQALERLAAAGDAEAIEALRVSALPSTPASPQTGSTTGGDSGSGGGFTPSTVLPLLLALVGAGYCVVNDLVPQEWLAWIGTSGSGGGVAGDGSGDSSPSRAGDESSLSPLLRTLSGVAAFVPMASSTAKSTSDGEVDAETEAASARRTVTGGRHTAEPRRENQGEAQGEGWSPWRWWGGGKTPEDPDAPSAVVPSNIEEHGNAVLLPGEKGSDASSASPAGEEGSREEGERGGVRRDIDDASEQQQQQRTPRWLRWGAPPPASPPSGSS